jgi:hypothetical protein
MEIQDDLCTAGIGYGVDNLSGKNFVIFLTVVATMRRLFI